jgi:2-iminobutanoate/2-iminopropanoate deaminase
MSTKTAPAASRTALNSSEAPAAIGPYSHAIAHAGVLYCSGALPIDPTSGRICDESVATETERCLLNLEAVCREAGTSLHDALRLTIYTTRLEDFAEINDSYAAHFTAPPPARAAIGVSALPKGANVEIDAIVALRR